MLLICVRDFYEIDCGKTKRLLEIGDFVHHGYLGLGGGILSILKYV